MNAIWLDVLDRYSNTLVRSVVEPQAWMDAEYPIDGHTAEDAETCHVVRQHIIAYKWAKLKECHLAALELNKPRQRFEHLLTTLMKYVTLFDCRE